VTRIQICVDQISLKFRGIAGSVAGSRVADPYSRNGSKKQKHKVKIYNKLLAEACEIICQTKHTVTPIRKNRT